MPYDPAPPAGIPASWGITVNAQFSQDNFQTVHTIPAFYYQSYEYQVKGNRDWFNPLDQYAWKVRFAPPREGSWQYRLTATDASGTVTSAAQSFSVIVFDQSRVPQSVLSGPAVLRIRERHCIYRPGLQRWHRLVATRCAPAPARFATMGQNGVELSRIWLSQSAIFGSAWNPWYGLRGDYGGYIPRTGLTPAGTPAEVKLRLSYAEDASGNKNTGYFEACRFIGGFQSATAVKRNTNYHFTVRYSATRYHRPAQRKLPELRLRAQDAESGERQLAHQLLRAGQRQQHRPGRSRPTPTAARAKRCSRATGAPETTTFLPPFYMALENVSATNPANGRIPAVYVVARGDQRAAFERDADRAEHRRQTLDGAPEVFRTAILVCLRPGSGARAAERRLPQDCHPGKGRRHSQLARFGREPGLGKRQQLLRQLPDRDRKPLAAAGLVALPAGAMGLFTERPFMGTGQRRRSRQRPPLHPRR